MAGTTINKDGGYTVIEFDSLSSHADYITENNKSSYSYNKTLEHCNGFIGIDGNLDTIIGNIRYGDEKLTTSLLNLKEQDNYEAEEYDIHMDIEGFAYDMGSVICGEPECCLNTNPLAPKKTIEIVVDLGYSGGVYSDAINYRSIAIMNLVTSLQREGYIVKLSLLSTYPGNYQIHKTNIDTDIVSASQLAVGTSSYYWRGASWLTVQILNKGGCDGGMDGSRTPQEVIDQFKKDNIFYIGGGYTDSRMNYFDSVDEANGYIQELFSKFIDKELVA